MTDPKARSFWSRVARWHPPTAALADPRAFLQGRVELVAAMLLAMCLVSLVGVVASPLLHGTGTEGRPVMSWLGPLIGHSIFAGALGAGWLYCRRGTRSERVLHALESVGMVLATTALGFVILMPVLVAAPHPPPHHREHLTLLVLAGLVCRAALVPSSALRTVGVGLVSILPMTGATLVASLLGPTPAGLDAATRDAGFVASWGLVFVFVTGVTSRVIYGLQTRAREVMELGQYTLEGKIGEGGMGAVYRARHALLRRPTAIKLLPPETSGEEALKRFEQEVQQTSRLTHPNTVVIYDYGHTTEGVFYYVMEHLDGPSLEELVAMAGPLPPGRVIHVLAQVAGALAEAHDAGLIHRDIKPGNILLVDRGGVPDTAKVVDFGLVKDIGAREDLALTAQDVILGTPHYMAPEQIATPTAVDGRADLYSLGAVGYFLLTGCCVFEGRTAMAVIANHLKQPAPPMSERSARGVPADLEAVVMSCLAKSPDDRPQSARALEAELLACGDAGSWGRGEAEAWWAEHADALRGVLRGRRREGEGVDAGDTIALLPTLGR